MQACAQCGQSQPFEAFRLRTYQRGVEPRKICRTCENAKRAARVCIRREQGWVRPLVTTYRCRNFHSGCTNRLSRSGLYCGTCHGLLLMAEAAERAAKEDMEAADRAGYLYLNDKERWRLPYKCQGTPKKVCLRPILMAGMCWHCATGEERPINLIPPLSYTKVAHVA